MTRIQFTCYIFSHECTNFNKNEIIMNLVGPTNVPFYHPTIRKEVGIAVAKGAGLGVVFGVTAGVVLSSIYNIRMFGGGLFQDRFSLHIITFNPRAFRHGILTSIFLGAVIEGRREYNHAFYNNWAIVPKYDTSASNNDIPG